jgi:hypothetical protein
MNAVRIDATRMVIPVNSKTVISLLGSLARKYDRAKMMAQSATNIQL